MATRNSIFAVIIAAVLFLPANSSVSGRQWKATPRAMAQDYATINDTRPDGELVFLIWFVPQMVRPEMPNADVVSQLLKKFILMMVVDGRVDQTSGTMSFQEISTLQVKNQAGEILNPISRDDLPPINIAMLTGMEAAMRQSLGAMGKGMKVFMFDGSTIDSCKKGQLSTAFANETYTWNTPIPG